MCAGLQAKVVSFDLHVLLVTSTTLFNSPSRELNCSHLQQDMKVVKEKEANIGYQEVPVSGLYHVLLDQKWNSCILQDKEISSLMSCRTVKEHKLYSNHPQPCNRSEMFQLFPCVISEFMTELYATNLWLTKLAAKVTG